MDSTLEQIRKAETEALKISPAFLGCPQEILLNHLRGWVIYKMDRETDKSLKIRYSWNSSVIYQTVFVIT